MPIHTLHLYYINKSLLCQSFLLWCRPNSSISSISSGAKSNMPGTLRSILSHLNMPIPKNSKTIAIGMDTNIAICFIASKDAPENIIARGTKVSIRHQKSLSLLSGLFSSSSELVVVEARQSEAASRVVQMKPATHTI